MGDFLKYEFSLIKFWNLKMEIKNVNRGINIQIKVKA